MNMKTKIAEMGKEQDQKRREYRAKERDIANK